MLSPVTILADRPTKYRLGKRAVQGSEICHGCWSPRVVLSGTKSSWQPLSPGARQGSRLGPGVFNPLMQRPAVGEEEPPAPLQAGADALPNSFAAEDVGPGGHHEAACPLVERVFHTILGYTRKGLSIRWWTVIPLLCSTLLRQQLPQTVSPHYERVMAIPERVQQRSMEPVKQVEPLRQEGMQEVGLFNVEKRRPQGTLPSNG